MLELLLIWCSRAKDQESRGVDYRLLVQIINWKLDLDIPEVERIMNDAVYSTDQQHQVENEKEVVKKHSYKTTSQQVKAATGEISTSGMHVCMYANHSRHPH